MSNVGSSNYFVHTLLRARDWQHRPQLDEVIAWWQDGCRGVCAAVGMRGVGKTVIADQFSSEWLDRRPDRANSIMPERRPPAKSLRNPHGVERERQVCAVPAHVAVLFRPTLCTMQDGQTRLHAATLPMFTQASGRTIAYAARSGTAPTLILDSALA